MTTSDRLIVASTAYGAARKAFIASRHKVETDASRSSVRGEITYRSLLVAEAVPLVIVSGMIGPLLILPNLYRDMREVEVALRGLDRRDYVRRPHGRDSDSEHTDAFQLILV